MQMPLPPQRTSSGSDDVRCGGSGLRVATRARPLRPLVGAGAGLLAMFVALFALARRGADSAE